MAGGSVVAREQELEAISGFLDLDSGRRALVLEGEAGMGKTTLWREATGSSLESGCRVLKSNPSPAEAGFAFSGLDDLLGDSLDGIEAGLPAWQMAALQVALLRREAVERPADPRAISVGVLSALRALAEEAAVVVAIDDVHWLDRQSAAALAYAFRRLDGHRVRLVVSLRLDPALPASELIGAIPPELAIRIRVGPMTSGALHRAIRMQLGRSLPRPVLLRVHQLAGGNPFYALELARSLPDDPQPGFALPPTLEQVTHERLGRLADPVRRLLEPAALLSDPTAAVLEQISEDPNAAGEHLDEAVAAGVIGIEADHIRFTHPLLAEGMAAMIGPRRRGLLHRQLAGLVADPEERARHLALATVGPDAEVARALEDAARHSRARGAPDAAAELAELARRLTPPEDVSALLRLGLQAAEYQFDAGDAAGATNLLRDVIASSPPGPGRAEVLHRLSSMSWMNLIHGVREPALQALEESGENLQLRSGIHQNLAWVGFYLGDLDTASDHARRSLEYAMQVADPATRADGLATLGVVEFACGRPSEDLMAEAVELQDAVPGSWTEASVYTTPRCLLGLELMWSGRLDEARKVLERELAEYERHGMYTGSQEVLSYLSWTETRAGRWQQAARHAADAMETIVESGQTATLRHAGLWMQSMAAAHLGQIEDARRLATEGLQLSLSNDDLHSANGIMMVLGFLELSLARFEQARAHLEPVVAYLDRMGAAEPGIFPCVPDMVEALVALGRADEAEPLVDRLEAQGKALDRPWAQAVASRCRGLIAAARHDLDGSRAALERAVVEHEGVPQPFERGRTLLALGSTLRRLRRMKDSRETLHDALAIFEELGAELWADKARAEVARIGGRAPASDELTSSERRIAELVSEGKTNKEVAAILVVADRTVESALTQIYRKLDVRSRTELARKISSPK